MPDHVRHDGAWLFSRRVNNSNAFPPKKFTFHIFCDTKINKKNGVENAIGDSNSIFDTEERLVKELEEFQVTGNFKSLFEIKKDC